MSEYYFGGHEIDETREQRRERRRQENLWIYIKEQKMIHRMYRDKSRGPCPCSRCRKKREERECAKNVG